nr:hypothetical protein [Tanacetum cinerariifolium]
MPPKRNGMSAAAIEQLIAHRVADALSDYNANQNSANGNDNGNGSHDLGSGSRRTLHIARGCTYKEFLNCQPLNFKRIERAVALTHWFEKMESVFHHVSAPPSKNHNRKNQAGSSEACGRVYALGGGEVNQSPSNIVDDIDA